MASKNIKTRIKHKRDTSANWTKNDPVLLNGEVVIVDTANGETRTKTGDGTSKYSALPFDDEAIKNLINNKVEKVTGKGLSTNDYDATEKSHVQTAYNHSQADHAPSNAEANVQSDWNVTNTSSDAYIKNKPSTGTSATSGLTKIYTATGTNTDGTMTQKAITDALGGKSDTGHTHSSYANQYAYSNVKVGTTTVSAKSATDTITLEAGDNVTLTPDATNKKVTIKATNTVYTHPTSGVTAGTYKSVTVNAQGHVTGGTNPTTISGYGITDAKISSGTITLGGNTITPLTSSSSLNATKLTGTASIDTTGNATTATKATQDGSGNVIVDTYATKTELNNFLAASDAMVIRGGIAGGSTGNYGALTPAANRGDCYKATAAGKINGVAVEIGDMVICYVDNTAKATTSNYTTINANWFIVQNNVDLATQSTAGLLSATDKAKLDGITSSADSVSFSRSLTSGTKVGTITINGTATDLYAPSAPGTASSSSAGIMKLYTSTGTNTDGTMTQSAIKSALDQQTSELDTVTEALSSSIDQKLDTSVFDSTMEDMQNSIDGKAASSHSHSTSDITSGTLAIARGGTGATTVADARTNLSVYSKDETDTKFNGKASSRHKHIMSDVLDLNLVKGTGFSYNEDGVTASGTYGVLAPSSGGTGVTSITENSVLFGRKTTPPNDGNPYIGMGSLALPSTAGSFLRQGTSGAPYWSKPADVLSAIGGVIKSDTGWLQYNPTTYPSVWYRVANDVVYVRGFSSATTSLAANTYTKVGYITGNYWADEELYFSANSLGGGKQIDGMIDSEGNIKLYVTNSTSYWAFTFSYPIA